jgi:hypothetical protein
MRTVRVCWLDTRVRDSWYSSSVASSRNLNLYIRSPFLSIHYLYISTLYYTSYSLVCIIEVLCCLIHHLSATIFSRYSFG